MPKCPKGAVAYNSCMNLYGIRKSVYAGADALCHFGFTNGYPHNEQEPTQVERWNAPCRDGIRSCEETL